MYISARAVGGEKQRCLCARCTLVRATQQICSQECKEKSAANWTWEVNFGYCFKYKPLRIQVKHCIFQHCCVWDWVMVRHIYETEQSLDSDSTCHSTLYCSETHELYTYKLLMHVAKKRGSFHMTGGLFSSVNL